MSRCMIDSGFRVDRTADGLRSWSHTRYGGVEACTSRLTPWGAHTNVKLCPGCRRWHSAADPPLCHKCAFGL